MSVEKDYAQKRISDDFNPVSPGNDIMCRKCIFKKAGVIGYKNGYCDAYPDGKPNGILFNRDPCNFYTEEASA